MFSAKSPNQMLRIFVSVITVYTVVILNFMLMISKWGLNSECFVTIYLCMYYLLNTMTLIAEKCVFVSTIVGHTDLSTKYKDGMAN